MDALINHCLKPVASTLPLATDEIKKLHAYKFFFKMDAMNAFWSIPLDDESKKLMAFQTHEGVFAWNRLTMGCRPASIPYSNGQISASEMETQNSVIR